MIAGPDAHTPACPSYPEIGKYFWFVGQAMYKLFPFDSLAANHDAGLIARVPGKVSFRIDIQR